MSGNISFCVVYIFDSIPPLLTTYKYVSNAVNVMKLHECIEYMQPLPTHCLYPHKELLLVLKVA